MDTEQEDIETTLTRIVTWGSILALVCATILLTKELEHAQRPADLYPGEAGFVGRIERSR